MKMVNFLSVDGVIPGWYYCNGKAVWWRDDSGKVKVRFLKGYYFTRPVIRINHCNMAFYASRAVDNVEKILNAHYFNMLGRIDFKAADVELKKK